MCENIRLSDPRYDECVRILDLVTQGMMNV